MRLRTIIPVLAILVLQVSCGTALNDRASLRAVKRVACVGDSITFGANITNRERDSYPSVLQRLCGTRYEVHNFGVSGANLIKKGDKPYWREPAFSEVTSFAPDIVIIMLGTNDTKPTNWDYKTDFPKDLNALIVHFEALQSKPKIWLCIPVPVYKSNWGINEKALDELIPMIRQVANEKNLPAIDLFTPLFNHPDYFADGIHPNEKGANVIAEIIYNGIHSASLAANDLNPSFKN